MAKFRFRLETLLRLRMSERDERRAELAEALHAEEQLKLQQAEVEQEIQQQHDYVRQATSNGRLNIDLITAAQRQVGFLKAVRLEKQSLMRQLIPHIQQRRQALIDADHEVRTLEKLKEHKLEQHNQWEAAVEAKQMDEIALSGFRRKGG